MKVVVSGASGLIGSALVPHLRSSGHEVVRLVRREPTSPDEAPWDPSAGTVDLAAIGGVDAVINLSGAGVGDRRWTPAYKAEIKDSRVQATSTLATAMAALDPLPSVLVNGSAIGWYGETGDRPVNESAPAGEGFLAEVVRDWEAATAPAQDAGIRVVHARTGLVVARQGGAWARLFPIFRLGLGGRLGSGRQYWSWISMRDEVRALSFLLEHQALRGPVNLTAPHPATNAEVTAAMGKALGRPTLLPVPALALQAALGEFSSEVLGSAYVLPTALEGADFTWQDPRIEDAIRSAMG
ncbi:MAG: TIGR01777 family oxidoreductase [Actinomycetales bacterium]|nr:TIGR01777 family oxidoreductase [Actinomycetales bacterium]